MELFFGSYIFEATRAPGREFRFRPLLLPGNGRWWKWRGTFGEFPEMRIHWEGQGWLCAREQRSVMHALWLARRCVPKLLRGETHQEILEGVRRGMTKPQLGRPMLTALSKYGSSAGRTNFALALPARILLGNDIAQQSLA